MMKNLIRIITPPIIYNALVFVYRKATSRNQIEKANIVFHGSNIESQELDTYWSKTMLEKLETWGETDAWVELDCLFAFRSGTVLDVACGTGVNMKALDLYEGLNNFGIDISDVLVNKAIEKGISRERIFIGDASENLPFEDSFFDFHYSVGSLEHFTLEGLDKTLTLIGQKSKKDAIGFHQVPVSADGTNMGWITRHDQSYWNNNEEFWIDQFEKHFKKVSIIRSSWKDQGVSKGIWICTN